MLYALTLLGCTTYSSPVLRVIWWIWPRPVSARRPRPVTCVLPQWARLLIGQLACSCLGWMAWVIPCLCSAEAREPECGPSMLVVRFAV